MIVSDSHCIRPRSYIHRHKLHQKPNGWGAMGPLEARYVMEDLLNMVAGNSSNANKIYREKPHGT